MKQGKRIASLALALLLVLALSVSALAAGEGTLTGGTITINDAVPGQVYSAYQILYLESYNATEGAEAYAYKANSAWKTWLKTQTSYVKFDDQDYVTWVEGADAAAFAKLAQAEAAKMTADGTQTAPAAAEGQTYSMVKFENLQLGYYLVDSTLGTLCSLDTTNPNAVIEEKNEVPSNEKKVKEDSTNNFGDKNDADIGQVVEFQSTITAQAGAENYVFHDTMSAGLTFGSVTGITLNGTAVAETNYTVKKTGITDGCTFEVSFTQAFCDTLKANDKIVISYTATVNENAVIGGNGNPNESKIEYGESGKTNTTPPSETKTYTWKIDVLKYTMKEETKTPLAGAKFVLYKEVEGTKNYVIADASNKVTGWTTEKDKATVFETPASGTFTISGLDSDTYYLEEIEAPAGYNKLKEPVTVTIGENGVVNATTEKPEGVSEVEVLNQTGTELPSTGGVGTTVFYVLGSVLVLGAAVLLITRRRMKRD